MTQLTVMLRAIIFIAIVGVGSTNGFLSNWFHPKKWNGFKVTFGLNPFSSWNMDSMPRTVQEATRSGFKLVDTQCSSEGQSFRGKRYQYRDDPHVLVLFDKNDIVAGIQTRAPADKLTPSRFNENKAYVRDGEFWTLTVYFVAPDTICSQGRTAAELAARTGTGLYIQNGTRPETDVFVVPKTEEEMKKTKWGNGKCFPMMGKHYWYDIRPDMPAEKFFPYCILYNGGKLDAFCFAMDTYMEIGKRFEHPDGSSANKCCINAPKFFFDPQRGKVTTMHVYMTNSPRTSFC